MRKKWLAAGAGFGIGAVMLLIGGLSAMAGTSGYETYKEALIKTKAASSMTANAEWTLTDNGSKVISGSAEVKVNKAAESGSVTAVIDDGKQAHSFQVFRQDGKVIFKSGDEDVYRVAEQQNSKPWGEDDQAGPPKAVEQVFDALMGNITKLATVESASDGSLQTGLHLSGSQIPSALNALASLAVTKAADSHASEQHKPMEMDINLPKLTDNVRIEAVNLDAKISPDRVIERQTAEFRITGTDASGKDHELVLQLQIAFSKLDQTVPDRVDLTGKQTVEIKHSETGRGWHH